MRRLPKAILTLAACTACLATLAPAALAGSYVVNTCSPLTTPGIWALTNTDSVGLIAGQSCGGPAVGPVGSGDQGALYAEDTAVASSHQIPDGAQAGWTFIAPAQTTITAVSYYRALASYATSDLVAGLFQGPGATPLEQCMIPWPFPRGSSIVCSMPNTQGAVTFTGLATTSLFFGVLCRIVDGASGCLDGGGIHYAQADLYSAKVTLTQSALPTLSSPGGPLWAGGVVSGTVPVTFAASDPSGIQQDAVTSDSGQTLISATQACDYTAAQPCPQLPATSLSVDTTRVPDGRHMFAIVATDAAGNTQTTSSPPVVVDNHGPPAPAPFTATATANTINLTWTNPAGPPAPIAGAMAQLCQATCSAPLAVSAAGSAQLPAPGPGQYSARLWLLDAQGRGGPQNAATATVTVPASGETKPGGSDPGGPHPGSTTTLHTKIVASYKARRLHVTGTIAGLAEETRVRVSWRSHSFLRPPLGSGSRVVRVHLHKIDVTFTITSKARQGTIGVAVRIGHRLLAGALARPA